MPNGPKDSPGRTKSDGVFQWWKHVPGEKIAFTIREIRRSLTIPPMGDDAEATTAQIASYPRRSQELGSNSMRPNVTTANFRRVEQGQMELGL